jgi:hypothetical protein
MKSEDLAAFAVISVGILCTWPVQKVPDLWPGKVHLHAWRSATTCRLWTADGNSHVMLRPCRAVPLRSCFKNGLVVAWHGRGMACVNQIWPHCVNKMGKTQSKHFWALHGRGMAWYVWISLYETICFVYVWFTWNREVWRFDGSDFDEDCHVVCDM